MSRTASNTPEVAQATPIVMHYASADLPDIDSVLKKLAEFNPTSICRNGKHVVTWEKDLRMYTVHITFHAVASTDVKEAIAGSRQAFRSLLAKKGIKHLSQD